MTTTNTNTYNIELLKDFDFNLLWITSDQVMQLNKWYEIPVVCMDDLRTVVTEYWKCGGRYKELEKDDRVQYLFQQLESAGQYPEKLLRWYLDTQPTPGRRGGCMIAWTEHLKECSARKQLGNLSSTVNALLEEYVMVPYSRFLDVAKPLETLWTESPAHRTDWDEYLYKICFEELCEAPSAIADDEVMMKQFRKFWCAVLQKVSEAEVRGFEDRLWRWSMNNGSSSFKIDPKYSIEKSFGMDGFLDAAIMGSSG